MRDLGSVHAATVSLGGGGWWREDVPGDEAKDSGLHNYRLRRQGRRSGGPIAEGYRASPPSPTPNERSIPVPYRRFVGGVGGIGSVGTVIGRCGVGVRYARVAITIKPVVVTANMNVPSVVATAAPAPVNAIPIW
jgi:hypothetical protein